MWMNFGIKDLIDVLLVAFFLYQTYKLMKNSGTLAIFSGVDVYKRQVPASAINANTKGVINQNIGYPGAEKNVEPLKVGQL